LGNGYAAEAAREALRFGIGPVGLDEIVSFTPVLNAASVKVMGRIDMHRDPSDDFDYPRIPLRRNVLFRLKRDELAASESAGGQSTTPA
jgi:RimJ/RimL family protein N-acetyltransferase